MTGTPPPSAPDGSALTPEEWDAVRRLRGAPADDPAATATAEPQPEPEPLPEPEATAEPLPPVQPVPPAEQTEPPVQDSGAAVASRRRPRRTVSPAVSAIAALAVLAVVAAVLAALTGLKVSSRRESDRASTAALAAATAGVATVLSYNYRSLDHDFSVAEALLTPSFRKSYETTTAKAVQPLAAKYKAVSTAQVSAAGVISATGSHATVLVFVSQQVTNTQLSAPRLDRSRIQVELVHTKGRWLIAKLSPV